MRKYVVVMWWLLYVYWSGCADQMCSNLLPCWSECLSCSVVTYWSSLASSVFILTSVCINTSVTRGKALSDQITSSTELNPLCGFGTQRSRPLAGGLSQSNTRSGEGVWVTARQTKTEQLSWMGCSLSVSNIFFWRLSLTGEEVSE